MPLQAASRIGRTNVALALRKSQVVVVMNADLVKSARDMVNTMVTVHKLGLIAETTFRIKSEFIREAMAELRNLRAQELAEGKFFPLGIGSITRNSQLEEAEKLEFDMLVGPGDMVSGGLTPLRSLQTLAGIQGRGFFLAPAAAIPSELQHLLDSRYEYDQDKVIFSPDAIKIFPAKTSGLLDGLLEPFKIPDNADRIIMPTGGVNVETGPAYIKAITKANFFPVLGMSSPLELVKERKAFGDQAVIEESIRKFAREFIEKNNGPFGAITEALASGK